MEQAVFDSVPAPEQSTFPPIGYGNPPPQFQITKADARAKQAKSIQSLKKRLAAEKLARETPPIVDNQAQQPVVIPARGKGYSYVHLRLIRVRKQLDRLDAMIAVETDPVRMDKWASASHKLSQQERELSGRPAPGTLKPSSPATAQPGRALNYLQGTIKPQNNRHVEQE